MPRYPYNATTPPPNVQTGVPGVTNKLGTVAHFSCVPPTVSVTAVHADITLGAGGTTSAGITQPAVPCVLQIKGTGAGATGNVVIHGTDYAGAVITDTIALAGAGAVNGARVFKTVTAIDYPADSGATGEKVSVGNTKLIGLPDKLSQPVMLKSNFNAANDAGTLTVDAAHLYGNYYTVAGTPDSAKVLDLYYVLN